MLFSLMIVKTIMAAVSSRSITVKVVLPMLLENNLLAENENRDRIYLTKRGRDVSNAVLAEFLLEEE